MKKTAIFLKNLHAVLIGIILLSTAIITTAFATTTTIEAKKTPLIPRKVFFANPEKTAASISHDGTKIAFLAPVNGVLNIWVTDSNDVNLSHAKPITQEKKRDLLNYSWSFNNNIIYTQDQNGDENSHLYYVDLKTNEIKDLTPFPKIKVGIVKMSSKFPNELLIALNNRDPQWHDVYRLNIITGKLTLIEKNDQFVSFIADENLQLRVAKKPTVANSPEFYTKDATGQWQFYERVPFEDALLTHFIGFDQTGTIAYKIETLHRDKAAIYAVNLSTRKKTLLAASTKADCSDLLLHPVKLTPQAFAIEYDKVEWTILDPAIKQDFSYLKNAGTNIHDSNNRKSSSELAFSIVSRTLADDKWILHYYNDTNPSRFYLYERDPKTGTPQRLTFMFTALPTIEKHSESLAPMRPIIIEARDGLKLLSYLTLPPTKTITSSVITPNTPLPMVLLVHGGPWARDSWRLNIRHQWLANRGYAVLSVNYRGSTGFGKSFISAGNNEWGRKMHRDLIDAVNWAIGQKIADPQKVAIVGGSYGGYAALSGLTLTPNVFNCGVSIVGPSNLITLLKSVPEYWKPDIAIFKKRVGNIDTAAGRKMLRERSPLTYADRIKKPLLILQGEHDPRVKKTESDQIAAKMVKKNIPVTYVLYHDEGHGFVREPNRCSSNAIIEEFLAKNLGGYLEPINPKVDFAGANFSVVIDDKQQKKP